MSQGAVEVEALTQSAGATKGNTHPARSWGRTVAMAVVGLLALAAVVAVTPHLLDRGHARRETPIPSPATVKRPRADTAIAATQRALSAWGRFAVTGDLRELGSHFDVNGPQYQQFAAEARSMTKTGGIPYEVAAHAVVQDQTSAGVFVQADVVWRRPGEDDQTMQWIVELRPAPDGWAVWSARSARPR